MAVIQEGNLKFNFGSSWNVIKYDENGSFYRTKISNSIEQTKAVDFLCIRNEKPLCMVEIKDYSLGVSESEKFENVPKVVALKTRDTIAGIVGGLHCATNSDQRFFRKAYNKLTDAPFVVFFFEDLLTPKRHHPLAIDAKKGVLLKSLKKHLRWLTGNVAVIDLNNYRRYISDLTVNRV